MNGQAGPPSQSVSSPPGCCFCGTITTNKNGHLVGIQPPPPSPAAHGVVNKLLRCSRCRSHWYCSKACQKKDWKRHKKICQKIAPHRAAQEAWNELQQLIQFTSHQDAAEAFHRTNDKIAGMTTTTTTTDQDDSSEARLQSQVQDTSQEEGNGNNIKSPKDAITVSSTEIVSDNGKDAITPRPENLLSSKAEVNEKLEQSGNVASSGQILKSSNTPAPLRQVDRGSLPSFEDERFRFYIEEMPPLKCYQIEVRSKSATHQGAIMMLENWSIRVETHAREEASTVSLHNAHYDRDMTFRLPGHVNNAIDSVAIVDDILSMRLSFEASCEIALPTKLMTKQMANRLCCSGCNNRLVHDEESMDDDVSRIERVAALPSGWWDDMSDYLICFEGQPSVDFSSSATAARTRLVLEDDSVAVYHTGDVSNSVQVLALPGYGDGEENENDAHSRAVPLVRGGRSWSDTVGGATVTCSRCCLVLGIAPVELVDTVRFYKHRVVVKEQTLLSSLGFCVHSMVRYAESKAIFSFIVRCEDQPSASLMLHLVGWDRKAARSFYKSDVNGELAWSRLAKVLYEERNGMSLPDTDSASGNWTWTQGDWCCPPTTGVSTGLVKEEKKTEHPSDFPASYVSLVLESSEWTSFKKELEDASQLYSVDLMNTTFLAKTGRLPGERTFCGLAGVFLDE